MIIVKKVDEENKMVTVSADNILQNIEFDKFLTIPVVSDVVQIQQSIDGAAKYVIVTNTNTGESVYSNGDNTSAKNKMIAGLLAIFVGTFGIHNFYLGNNSRGVVQILITVFGSFVFVGPFIVEVWAIIEGVLILTSKKGSKWHEDANGLELQD